KSNRELDGSLSARTVQAPEKNTSSQTLTASVAATPAEQPKIEDLPIEPSVSAAPIIPASPASDAVDSSDKTATGEKSAAPGHYLEVGSFKDPTWADHAVEKLGQLGFHAISVRKGR